MSLRHALLGLLVDSPQTGYDLTKRFETTLSRHAWGAGHSQIYPELKKLEGDGLITVVDEGARGSRTYGVTDEGRAELRRWMFSPLSDAPARNEFVLRLFLLSSLDLADVRTLVERLTAENAQQIAAMHDVIGRIDADARGDGPGYARFAAEFGLRWFQMQGEWARWVLTQIEQRRDQA